MHIALVYSQINLVQCPNSNSYLTKAESSSLSCEILLVLFHPSFSVSPSFRNLSYLEHSRRFRMHRLLLLLLSFTVQAFALPLNDLLEETVTGCGGDTSLRRCGSSLPSNFCCASDSTCLPVNGTGMVTAICCPEGSDCSRLETITCNITLQDATLFPASPVHSLNLTEQLPICGKGCCPMGYYCQNGACVVFGQTSGGGSTSVSSNAVTITTASSSSSSNTPTNAQPAILPSPTTTSSPTALSATTQPFSGRSFAAGFMPGILVGLVLMVLLICALRRRSNRHGVAQLRRGCSKRSIFGPIAHPDYGNRTDFSHNPKYALSRNSPVPRYGGLRLSSPASTRKFRIASLFHQSPEKDTNDFNLTPTPKITQLPTSLRRGSITPPIALRTKASKHSLRRQVSRYKSPPTDTGSNVSNSSQGVSPQDSRETINIRMSSPRTAHSPWTPSIPPLRFPRASRNDPASKPGFWLSYRVPPARTPVTSTPKGDLGTPYTPSKYGSHGGTDVLTLPRSGRPEYRDTTFSSLMEKAGFQKSDIIGSRR